MLHIIDNNIGNVWNDIVRSFKKWDIYYLYEYAVSLQIHGDGIPLLIYYEDNGERFCYVVMQKDIAKCCLFNNMLLENEFCDWETPYGYGGPLCDAYLSIEIQKNFKRDIFEYCIDNNIVSQFVRFSPILANENVLCNVIDSRYVHDTVYMDVTSVDKIIKNMDSKNRSMIRKAEKNHIEIVMSSIKDFSKFVVLYRKTMKKREALEYYNFSDEYFKTLECMSNNSFILYALYNGKVISGAVFLYNKNYLHYHLSGSDFCYRNVAPNNLLLYRAACWANEHGIKKFHLGGGMSLHDSVFAFKKQFNKNGIIPFYVGRTIFSQDSYDYLLRVRKQMDDKFVEDNAYMIQYRR